MAQADPARSRLSSVPRRLHPLTPFARLWGVVVVLAFVLLRDGGAGADAPRSSLPFIGGGFVLLMLLVLGAAYVSWWRTSFWFDDDGDLRTASGLVSLRERRVQLSRLQSVDVVRPLAARLLGLAELKIDVAGGRDANIKLAYLSQSDADALRAELLARSAGVEHDVATGPVPEAPETLLATVPTDQLLWSVLLGAPALLGFAMLAFVAVMVVVTRELGVLVTLLFVVIGPATLAFRDFTAYFNFTLAESPDGLRTRHGLIETRAQTIPPGRVQAIGLSQPLLWRKRGWVRVYVDVAGYTGASDNPGATVLMPVVPHDVAISLIARVLPGFDASAVTLAPAPRRARWRAPVQASVYEAGLGDAVVVTKYGRFLRRTAVVPYARVQSVRLEQGLYQRRLRLATVRVDTTSGPVNVVIPERDEAQARGWAEEIAARALAARGADTSQRWMRPR